LGGRLTHPQKIEVEEGKARREKVALIRPIQAASR
jgi:hypothetical protein